MTEHTIRLRGGWTCRAAGSHEPGRLLTLPVRWDTAGTRSLVLIRKFGRPPVDPDREILLLRMEHVQGIRRVSLNGRPIALPAGETARYEIAIGDLLERNSLILEIDVPDPKAETGGGVDEWGVISLVVLTRPLANEPWHTAGDPGGHRPACPPGVHERSGLE